MEDETLWHGWYRRHGGQIEMIGDHFPGDITTILLVLAALALLAQMARQIPAATMAAYPRTEAQVITTPTTTMNAALATGR